MISKNLLNLNRTRTFSEAIGDTLEFFRLNTGVLLQTHLFISLPIVILIAAAFFLIFNGTFQLLETVDSGVFMDSVAYDLQQQAWFIHTILFPAFAFLPISANTIIIVHLYERSGKDTVTFQEVRGELKRLPKLLLQKLIMLPVIFAPFLLLLLNDDPVGKYFLLIILVGPIANVFFTLTTCSELLVLQHNFNVFRAIGRSFEVMGNKFWLGYGVTIVVFSLYLLTSVMLEVPAWILENLGDVTILNYDAEGLFKEFARLIHAFSALAGYLLFSLPVISCGILYFSIKESINRNNIMSRINMIGTAETPLDIYAEHEEY